MIKDPLTNRIIGLAMEVHRTLGPGLYEATYEDCLCLELTQAGIPFQRQAPIPMIYKGLSLPKTFRADVLIGEDLILEVKAVDTLLRLHEAQILTYLRLSGRHIGLLFNFNTLRLKDGLRRFVR